MVPTQFGNVPDVAFEEIKQLRTLQQQQSGSIAVPISSFVSTNNNTVNTSNTPSDTISNQTRTTARDLSVNPSNGVTRSRSLASNSLVRPSVAAASTYLSNPAYQTPLFATNKQSFLTPTRFGISRLLTGGIPNNSSLPPAPSSSSTSYASNRSLPISTIPNIKHRYTNNPHNHTPIVTVNSAGAAATSNDPQRPHYETTYRASFIKPLAP